MARYSENPVGLPTPQSTLVSRCPESSPSRPSSVVLPSLSIGGANRQLDGIQPFPRGIGELAGCPLYLGGELRQELRDEPLFLGPPGQNASQCRDWPSSTDLLVDFHNLVEDRLELLLVGHLLLHLGQSGSSGDRSGDRLAVYRLGQEADGSVPEMVRVGAGAVALSAAPIGADQATPTRATQTGQLRVQAEPLGLEPRQISVLGSGHGELPSPCKRQLFQHRPPLISPSIEAHNLAAHPSPDKSLTMTTVVAIKAPCLH